MGQLVGQKQPLLVLDLATVALEELEAPKTPLTCHMQISRDGPIEGFCGYFDAYFRGGSEVPVERDVTLSTAPTDGTATHWGQQIFGFYPPLNAKKGDTVECEMFIKRQDKNHRLLRLEAKFILCGHGDGQRVVKDERDENFFVD